MTSSLAGACRGGERSGFGASEYSIILFDLDGTLVDSAVGIAAALEATGRARGPISVAGVRDLVSGGAARLVQTMLGLDDADVPAGLAAFREIYGRDPCRAQHLFPGVGEALATLAALGFRLGVCTNKPQALAERVIERLGLQGRFGAIVGSDPSRPDKPDPTPLVEAMRLLGGGGSIFVGDSMVDALAARAAGVPFVYAAFGYERVAPAYFETFAERFSDLVPVLQKVAARQSRP